MKKDKDPFGFDKAINYDKLNDPKVLEQLEEIFNEEEEEDGHEIVVDNLCSLSSHMSKFTVIFRFGIVSDSTCNKLRAGLVLSFCRASYYSHFLENPTQITGKKMSTSTYLTKIDKQDKTVPCRHFYL